MTQPSDVLVDALPYIDQGYDEPGVREAVSRLSDLIESLNTALSMVEEETRRYRPTKNYLEHLPPLNLTSFETEIMRNENERMQQRLPMDVLSMRRYELPPPPPGKLTDMSAWAECVDNSLAQLEHQATRVGNLELMLEYGCEAWQTYLEFLVVEVSCTQKKLQQIRKEIQEINWERKSSQTNSGEKLINLEATWVQLVSKNYDIEQAIANLETEMEQLKTTGKVESSGQNNAETQDAEVEAQHSQDVVQVQEEQQAEE